jgi:hypothetical protein
MMREKSSQGFYQDMKHRRGKEKYIKWCTRMERNGIVWIKARM